MMSYFPLIDVFYQQNNNKTGMIPLSSVDLSIYKTNFSFSLIFDNLHSIFYDGEFLIQDYFLPPYLVKTAIKWQFVD